MVAYDFWSHYDGCKRQKEEEKQSCRQPSAELESDEWFHRAPTLCLLDVGCISLVAAPRQKRIIRLPLFWSRLECDKCPYNLRCPPKMTNVNFKNHSRATDFIRRNIFCTIRRTNLTAMFQNDLIIHFPWKFYPNYPIKPMWKTGLCIGNGGLSSIFFFNNTSIFFHDIFREAFKYAWTFTKRGLAWSLSPNK